MVTIENFAVAVIGNSRYGWFNEGQTEGPAAHLHREMVDALYHEQINHLGSAFVECKIQTAPWVEAAGQWEEGALRWNFYDINILGDPALSVWTDEPITINATYTQDILVGTTSTSVTVTSGGLPMEDFTCSIMKDDELSGYGITDSSGEAEINFEPVVNDTGEASLIICGYNCLPVSYTVNFIPVGGIDVTDYDQMIEVYPNPSTGSIHILLNESTSDATMRIYNTQGQIVYNYTGKLKGGIVSTIHLSELNSGLYFLELESSNGKMYKKLVLK